MLSPAEKSPAPTDFHTAERPCGTVTIVMLSARELPSPPGAPPADPPSGVRPATRDARVAASGERDLAAFMKAQYERVPALAARLRVPVHEAEEMLQRALEKLWLHHESVDPSRWEAWLWQTIRFQRLDGLKRARRAQSVEPELALVLEQCQRRGSPEVEAYERECAGELGALLDSLAPERREVVWLYLIEELPMAEVAGRLGIPENTAKDRWRLACDDMVAGWERRRAAERSKRRIAAFLASLAALIAALWRRVVRRGGGNAARLFAYSMCALALAGHDGPARSLRPGDAGAALSSAEIPATLSSAASAWSGGATPSPQRSPLDYAFAPTLHTLAEPERDHMRNPPSAQASEVPRRLMIRAQAALQEGDLAGVRAILAEYIGTYPHDPLPEQYAKLAAAVAAP